MIFNDIGIFIDSGFLTIPYDSITYNSEGKKVAFPPVKWKQYKLKKNTQRSPAGAVICGDILVVDCDTLEATLEFLKVLNIQGLQTIEDLQKFNNLEDLIGLVVETTRGYHFYFKNNFKLPDSKFDKIDIQASDKKIVYLPTSKSEGKKILAVNVILNEAGERQIHLTNTPKEIKQWIEESENTSIITPSKPLKYALGTPLARIELGTPLFYKRLTPKIYRENSYYRAIINQKGYLHPNDIKDGDGNDYFTSIAGILCSDVTIDVNAFWEIVEFLNTQWDKPLSKKALEKKLQGYVENNYPNCPFLYDPEWDSAKYSFIDVDGNDITMAYDIKSSKYLIANRTTNELFLKNSTDALSYFVNRTRTKVTQTELAAILPGVNLIFNPLEPFGFVSDSLFNTYKHSKYLEILNSNDAYSDDEIEESKNCKALPFFKHLFKNETDYFVRFLKTKFTSFAYSPTSFCLFDDEGGAGKGALEVFLGKFIGGEKITRIPYDTFNSKFTSEYEGKLIVFFNEFPDDYKARKINTDKIKEITGSPRAKIEKKGQDPYETDNLATFFITSNRVSIEVREGDRRFLVVQCDTKFDNRFYAGYFDEMISDEELTKLAIYLRYHIKSLDKKDYMCPPNSEAKTLFIDCNESDLDFVIRCLIEKDYLTLYNFNKEIINARYGAINLTKLAEYVGVKTKTLTQGLRKKIGQNKLKMEFKRDTNRNMGVDCDTYGMVEITDLAKFLPNVLKNTKNSKI